MSNVHVVYEPDDEIEARAIEGLLREEGIQCKLSAPGDTAYPGIGERGARWAILVHEDDLGPSQELIADWLEAEDASPDLGPYRTLPDDDPSEPGAEHTPLHQSVKGWLFRIVVSGALLASLAANLHFIVEQRYPDDTVTAEDADGRRLYEASYGEGPYATRTREYDTEGQLTSDSLDEAGDGRIERVTFVHPRGVRTSYLDHDEDGRAERVRTRRRGRLVHEAVDRDGDGLYERWTRDDTLLIDVDRDGFPDRVECVDGSGDPRAFDTITCSMR